MILKSMGKMKFRVGREGPTNPANPWLTSRKRPERGGPIFRWRCHPDGSHSIKINGRWHRELVISANLKTGEMAVEKAGQRHTAPDIEGLVDLIVEKQL